MLASAPGSITFRFHAATCIEAARLERRWNIEHQDFRVVVGADTGKVLIAHGFRPAGDQRADFRFVVDFGRHHFKIDGSLYDR